MDIRDLIHFAKYCSHLEHVALPFCSVFHFEHDIAARYQLQVNADSMRCLFVDDQNTYSINNLAVAAFLYHLFGRGVYTRLRLGHSLYRALRVFGEGFGVQEGKGLDYNLWMMKGPTDPFYDDQLSSPLEGDWYEKGYRLLGNVLDNEIDDEDKDEDDDDDDDDDDDVELEPRSDSEGNEMQVDAEEDFGSQLSIEI